MAILPFPASSVRGGPYGEPRGTYWHRGVDFPFGAGTPVKAAADGRVTSVHAADTDPTTNDPFGSYVEIDHGQDASGHTWYTRYHMLSRNGLVAVGKQVSEGEVIAAIGTTHDQNSSGPHLHFEVHTSNSSLWPNYSRYNDTVDPLIHYQKIPSGEDMSFNDDDRNKLNHLYSSLTPGIPNVKQDSVGWQKLNNTDSRVAALWQELMLGIEGVKFDGNVASRIRAVSDNAVTILGLVRQIAAGDIVDEAEIARLVAQSLNPQAPTLNDAYLTARSMAVND